MGCRCDDIPRCSNDIGRMEEILRVCKYADEKNNTVSDELKALAGQCSSTFYCKDMNGLESEEQNLNKKLVELLNTFVINCEKELQRREIELARMKSEDSEFHDEERDKHHHDD